MGKYIDWYLVEVERLIGQSTTREELHDTLREVGSHLSSAKEGAMAQGLEDRNAELAAVESFGTPSNFVKHVLGSRDSAGQRATTWLAVSSGICWAVFVPLITSLRTPELILAPLLLLTAFAISSFRTRPLKASFVLATMFAGGLIQLILAAIVFVPLRTNYGRVGIIERSEAPYGSEVGFFQSAISFLPEHAQATAIAALVVLAINWLFAALGMLPSRRARRSLVP
jgi:hypothetical protein